MTLLTVRLAVGFIQDVLRILEWLIPALAVLISLIRLLASLGVTVYGVHYLHFGDW